MYYGMFVELLMIVWIISKYGFDGEMLVLVGFGMDNVCINSIIGYNWDYYMLVVFLIR